MSDMIFQVKCLPCSHCGNTRRIIISAHLWKAFHPSSIIPFLSLRQRRVLMSMRANTIGGRSRQFCILCFFEQLAYKAVYLGLHTMKYNKWGIIAKNNKWTYFWYTYYTGNNTYNWDIYDVRHSHEPVFMKILQILKTFLPKLIHLNQDYSLTEHTNDSKCTSDLWGQSTTNKLSNDIGLQHNRNIIICDEDISDWIWICIFTLWQDLWILHGWLGNLIFFRS